MIDMKRGLWTLLLLACLAVVAAAQIREGDIKLRLAQSYDRAGNYESAIRLYEELVAKDPTNIFLIDALRRDYLQLKRYDDAIALLERLLKSKPNDVVSLAELGSAYLLKSDEANAAAAWDRAIATDPRHEGVYRIVADAMIQGRQFDRAIALYRQGRAACGDSTLFTPDVAYLCGIMLNYGEATREYLKMIRQNPAQLAFVQSRIAMYTGRTEGLSAATLVVEEAVKKDPDDRIVPQLLAWLYMEAHDFSRAYDVTKEIDRRSNAGGREMFNFAQRALRERAYTAAAAAFQDIIRSYPKFDQSPRVKFGYASALEASDDAADTLKLFGTGNPFTDRPETESNPAFSGAIAAYNQVISEYPTTDLAAQSLLRIAVIKQERYFDLNGARSALETIQQSYARFPASAFEGRLRLGEVYLEMGNSALADSELQTIAAAQNAAQDIRQNALFKLAEIDYFSEQFQNALGRLKTLTGNPSGDQANDALSLELFITENMTPNDSALREYARADFLRRQQKLSEALQRFQAIVSAHPSSDIIDETLITIGDIFTVMRRFPDAVAAYERLVSGYPESIVLDRTLLKIGQVWQLGLKDKAKAIAAYEQLLEKFPNSVYAGEARRRIRELRGDTI